MYTNLNKIYEMKQKKMQQRGNLLKRKKDNQEFQRKDVFKRKVRKCDQCPDYRSFSVC